MVFTGQGVILSGLAQAKEGWVVSELKRKGKVLAASNLVFKVANNHQ